MKTIKISFFVFGILLLSFPLYGDKGGEPGAFMKIGVGARAITLGGAYTGVGDDASSPYWNPAGLVQLKKGEFSFMYSRPFAERLAGIGYHTFGWVHPYRWGGLGINFIYLGVEDIQKYNEEGGYLGRIHNIEEAVIISFGRSINPRFSLGTSLKGIYHEVDEYSGTGFGIDVGMMAFPFSGLRFGLMVENVVAPGIQLYKERDVLPIKLRGGLSYRVPLVGIGKTGVLLSFDIEENTFTSTLHPRAGIELEVVGSIYIRGGYDESHRRLKGGMGVKVGNLGLDYGCEFHPRMMETHRVSLSIRY